MNDCGGRERPAMNADWKDRTPRIALGGCTEDGFTEKGSTAAWVAARHGPCSGSKQALDGGVWEAAVAGPSQPLCSLNNIEEVEDSGEKIEDPDDAEEEEPSKGEISRAPGHRQQGQGGDLLSVGEGGTGPYLPWTITDRRSLGRDSGTDDRGLHAFSSRSDVKPKRLREMAAHPGGRMSLPSTPVVTASAGKASDWQSEALLGASAKQRALLGVKAASAPPPPPRGGDLRTPSAGRHADIMLRLGIEALPSNSSAKQMAPNIGRRHQEGPADPAEGPYGGASSVSRGRGHPTGFVVGGQCIDAATSSREGRGDRPDAASVATGRDRSPRAGWAHGPWWLLLPDFVPVRALSSGVDPRCELGVSTGLVMHDRIRTRRAARL